MSSSAQIPTIINPLNNKKNRKEKRVKSITFTQTVAILMCRNSDDVTPFALERANQAETIGTLVFHLALDKRDEQIEK